MRAFLRGHWQLLALVAVIAALWQTPVVVPLKILIVFLHELGHVLAVVLTGGEVIARGGSRFISLSAGYLGSLIIGVLLFVMAVRTTSDRLILGALGAVLLAVTALYIRDGFAIGFTVAAGLGMLAMARFLPRDVNDLVLRIIGLMSMMYVPWDIFSDTLARSWLRSDARMLADEFGGTTIMWGGLWLGISLWVIWICLRRGLGADSNIQIE